MFKEILKLLTKNGKKSLLISSLFFALYSLCSIVMLVIVFSTFFKILSGKDMISLYKNFIFISILVIFKGICNMIADLEKHNAGFDIVQKIRELMIIKLKKFSLSFYTNERLGEINIILHKDVDNMSLVVGHMWSRMFGEFLVAFVVFFGLIMFNIKLALVMVIFIPIALGFLYFTIKKSKKIENKNNSALLDMVSLFVEYVRGIPVLKSFSNNKSLDKNKDLLNDKSLKKEDIGLEIFDKVNYNDFRKYIVLSPKDNGRYDLFVYINLAPLKYSKVILGPKVTDADYIAPYLKLANPDIEIESSKIPYRSV